MCVFRYLAFVLSTKIDDVREHIMLVLTLLLSVIAYRTTDIYIYLYSLDNLLCYFRNKRFFLDLRRTSLRKNVVRNQPLTLEQSCSQTEKPTSQEIETNHNMFFSYRRKDKGEEKGIEGRYIT